MTSAETARIAILSLSDVMLTAGVIALLAVSCAIIARKKYPQAEEAAEEVPPSPSRDAQIAYHEDQWRRYLETFVNGGRRIGTFARSAMCTRCPQEVERVDDLGNVSFGPLVTQRDWNDCTALLVEAAMLHKSNQGTVLAPGALASDVWKRYDLKFPRRACPVTRYLERRAKNWSIAPPNEE